MVKYPSGCSTQQTGFCFVPYVPFCGLSNSLIFLDLAVTNRDYAVGAHGNVVFVSDHDNRVAFGVETLEEVHDLHAGV